MKSLAIRRQATALEIDAVQSGDGLVGLFLVRHLNEAETAGFARELVLDDRRAGNLARRRESILEVLLGRRAGNVFGMGTGVAPSSGSLGSAL